MSRGSVSEILWAENVPSDFERTSRSKSSARLFNNSPSHKRIYRQSTLKNSQDQGSSTSGKAAAEYVSSPLEPLSSNISFQKRVSRSTDEDSNMTSFPELRPRHCTNDWINPPAEIEQLTSAPTTDLYHRGVDAHSGRPPASPETVWEAPQPIAVPCDHSIFDKDPFMGANPYTYDRRETRASGSTDKLRLGSSIGSASHRRRSSHVPMTYDTPWDSPDGIVPQILDKLRRNTQHDFGQSSLLRPEYNVWTAEARKSAPNEAVPVTKIRSRDSIVKERTLKPPKADSSGIYEALTGSRMIVGRGRHDTCSEDNRPHICENDMDHSKHRH
ncbi:D-xylulose reductase A [Pochonia chlamydosporia 170]|uniref:D-xylulose reductase A n=1 Tax=Pochonia chlamydosporia 170 TaxID=1380566 RepID=A0A219AS12_METCM|nr:D-xylulose reductase A [Pochonia chlamydosporia 170]OWT43556.1 D-xylulose reductase A [Pochonia chlamydosporia 170]